MAKKKKINIVYSTNPDHNFDYEEENEATTLPPSRQQLKVFIDRKNRKGKAVTVVTGFTGSGEDLKELGRELKSKCGVGGSVKDGEIIVQGELREKIFDLLTGMGYGVKKAGG